MLITVNVGAMVPFLKAKAPPLGRLQIATSGAVNGSM